MLIYIFFGFDFGGFISLYVIYYIFLVSSSAAVVGSPFHLHPVGRECWRGCVPADLDFPTLPQWFKPRRQTSPRSSGEIKKREEEGEGDKFKKKFFKSK